MDTADPSGLVKSQPIHSADESSDADGDDDDDDDDDDNDDDAADGDAGEGADGNTDVRVLLIAFLM